MNSYYLLYFLSDYVPHIALGLSFTGMTMVVKSMFTQELYLQQQAVVINQLREHVGECIKAQIDSHDQVDELKERCAKLLARQQRVEKRGPDAQRIELATRMLQRGQCDVQTLYDLGLSSSEIRLLTQLHSSVELELPKEEISFQPASAQGDALAQLLGGPASIEPAYSGETSSVT